MAVKVDHDEVTSAVIGDGPLKRPQYPKSRMADKSAVATAKRRCVSTACIACRRRKSKVWLYPAHVAVERVSSVRAR